MRRPWKTWFAFAFSAVLLVAAVGWVSLTALRLEAAQWNAAAVADREEKIRLALWRIDTALGAVLLEEGARSPLAYQPDPPSYPPIVWLATNPVLLHFQLDAAGRLTSPEVPPGAPHSGSVVLLAALERLLNTPPAEGPNPLDRMRGAARLGARPATRPTPVPAPSPVEPAPTVVPSEPADLAQQIRNTREQRARQNFNRQSQNAVLNNWSPAPGPPPPSPVQIGAPSPTAGLPTSVRIGAELFLVREAYLRDGRDGLVVQGCWLDWPRLRESLLGSVADLLPGAGLEPLPGSGPTDDPRALATLPLRLVPSPAVPLPIPAWTPVRISLAVAWSAFLAALLAVAFLLQSALSLSERRSAFVSAVTHELRSPLTTFRLYSEMLAEGMVPDDATRQTYLDTLCTESGRLTHLVENVLAFAGLERGSARRRLESIALADLVERIQPRLHQRARQAGLELSIAVDPEFASRAVRADVSAVEQILFNLVDNACKYAASGAAATERVLHLEAAVTARFGVLRLRDRGPGVAPSMIRRLFQPFGKSAQEAAHSAPGIGLGLALARRLSRSLGGDLRFEPTPGHGATFTLSLPLADSAG